MSDYLKVFEKFNGLRERLLKTMQYDGVTMHDLARRIRISDIALRNFIQEGKNKTRLTTLMRILKYIEMHESANK